jgi:hypothetical protein
MNNISLSQRARAALNDLISTLNLSCDECSDLDVERDDSSEDALDHAISTRADDLDASMISTSAYLDISACASLDDEIDATERDYASLFSTF